MHDFAGLFAQFEHATAGGRPAEELIFNFQFGKQAFRTTWSLESRGLEMVDFLLISQCCSGTTVGRDEKGISCHTCKTPVETALEQAFYTIADWNKGYFLPQTVLKAELREYLLEVILMGQDPQDYLQALLDVDQFWDELEAFIAMPEWGDWIAAAILDSPLEQTRAVRLNNGSLPPTIQAKLANP